ncbi:MAG: hypothetical protein M0Q90_11695 [Bacteroidales bacterium]|nr:hypothetical protein [Bacteroidales bacterium]
MKKIIALIDNFEESEIVTDYAIRLAIDLKKELEIVHFIKQEYTLLNRRVKSPVSLPLKLIQKTDALVEKRSRILKKIISVKQASVDLPFSLKYTVKQMPLCLLIRCLNKHDDVDRVIIPVSNSNIANELENRLKHPLFVFKI